MDASGTNGNSGNGSLTTDKPKKSNSSSNKNGMQGLGSPPAASREKEPATVTSVSYRLDSRGNDESCLKFFLLLRSDRLVKEALWSYPRTMEEVEAMYPMIWEFVFPGSSTSSSADELNHTFVFTDGHGVRVYGHCTAFVNGEVVVSISPYPWCHFLTRLATFFRIDGYERGKDLVRALAECPIPPCGGTFQLPVSVPIEFRRPYDRMCPFFDTSPLDLFTVFPDTSTLFSLLADLLLEKHIIVMGPNFGLVSRVVMSLQTFISPFEWLHMLIPILPSSLLDVLAAPTPYLVGILYSQFPVVEKVPIERYVLVHLGSSGTCEGVNYCFEKRHVLPNSGIVSALRIGYNMLRLQDRREKTVHDLCSLFRAYYASLLGNIVMQGAKFYIRSQCSKMDTSFYESLFNAQCFNTLAHALHGALADKDDLWMENEFVVEFVRCNATTYPVHYEKLMQGGCREEKGPAVECTHSFERGEELATVCAADHGLESCDGVGVGRFFFRFLYMVTNCLVCRRGDDRVTVLRETIEAPDLRGNDEATSSNHNKDHDMNPISLVK